MNSKGIITKTSTEKRDARRWLIIGAYLAGATTKEISLMSGVTQSSVRRVVYNFQKTGSPTIPKGLKNRGRPSNFVHRNGLFNLIYRKTETYCRK